MGTSTTGFSITDEDRARLDRLAERLSGGNRSAFLRASLSVMESLERVRDLAAIAEEHAAERAITDDTLLDAIKTPTNSVNPAMALPDPVSESATRGPERLWP